MLKQGDSAPQFRLPSLQDPEAQTLAPAPNSVLFFYPKDDTPGCTAEAVEFSQLKDEFAALGHTLLGASPDPLKKHEKFAAKHELTVNLVSDEQKDMLEAYGVWVEKQMYGKTYMGVERTTFLIDADGIVSHVWNKVKAKGHAAVVLDHIRNLAG